MGIQIFICNIIAFLNFTILPFLIAIAFLFFIWNMARYFIIQGGEEESRRKAKQNAIYGILAFVIILSIWGIVNLLVFGLGFSRDDGLTTDFFHPQYEFWSPSNEPVHYPPRRGLCPSRGGGGGSGELPPLL